MQKFTFNRQSTGLFTDQQNKLSSNQMELLSFINGVFSEENFAKQIVEKKNSYPIKQREILSMELKKKYAEFEYSDAVKNNLDALISENTFTITTGHQLSIFTGPLYLIYKIVHVIRLTEELNKTYRTNKFVPVFWMASEDHDFEEIQSVEIFNKKLKWETDQNGAVGRFDTDGLDSLKKDILSFFENQDATEIEELLNTYTGKDLSEATFRLIHKLFDSYGLIIVEADNPKLKKEFIPVMEKELVEKFSYNAVLKSNKQLEKEGLKLQVNAREINLFYLQEQSRERILILDDQYYIEGKGKLTEKEILFELYQYPERFSPNVILRPVYQEATLPNLCYVGGVGEMSYWLQLKEVFKEVNVPYPLIQTRTSILWIDPVMSKKIAKIELKLGDLFVDKDIVKKNYLKTFAKDELDFNVIDSFVEELKIRLIDKITFTDESLENYAQAEMVKMDKQIKGIEEKLVKVVKQRHDTAMKTIDQVFERFFPNNSMQERKMNLFSLAADGKVASKIEFLHRFIDPFDPDFIIIRE